MKFKELLELSEKYNVKYKVKIMTALGHDAVSWDLALTDPKRRLSVNDIEIISYVLGIDFDIVMTSVRQSLKSSTSRTKAEIDLAAYNRNKANTEFKRVLTKSERRKPFKHNAAEDGIAKKRKDMYDLIVNNLDEDL